MIEIRPFEPEDFGVLLDLANQAVPFAPEANAEWLEYRRAFDETRRVRRHYLATDNCTPIGYGGLEQQDDDPTRLRVYVVSSPQRLASSVGDTLFKQLLKNANELGAKTLWARELLSDESARAFFTGHGFVETERRIVPNFAPVVVFQLAMS